MEKCYLNNGSLFKKYAQLVTWFANTSLGRDYLGVPKNIALMLPNGYIRGDNDYRATFYTRAVFAPKLYPALVKLDSIQQWIRDFKEAKQVLAWGLGITRKMPAISKAVLLADNFYPDADPETTSVDGYVARVVGANDTWASFYGATDGTSAGDTDANYYTQIGAAVGADPNWTIFRREIYLFDTSSISDTASISSASLDLYLSSTSNAHSTGIRVVTSTPASNTAIGTADYDQLGTTAQATDKTIASLSTSAYNSWIFNATGIGNISKTGVSKFGTRITADADNSPPSPTAGDSYIQNILADNGSSQPRLVVTFGGLMTTKSKFW